MHMAAVQAAICSCEWTVIRTFTKILAVLFIAGACIYGGYLLIGGGAEIPIPAMLPPPKGPRIIMSMENFTFAQSDKAGSEWVLNASTADLYENKEAQLKEVRIVFKNPDKKEATVIGDLGTMDTGSGNASLRRSTDEVRVVTSDGYLLTTDSLFWKAGERQVWTTDPFKLLGSEIYLEGVGMTADVNMRTILVNNNVKAVLQE
jgi:LPS export ABC transporter protein LptC